ncbi:hypothetical protein SAMN05421770_10132 [Granulicella rosea]|uniref:Uncharacterized protein n=1 Tax=Granulicella rosea TaxID=474952 RepID=A0A239CR18_9BACT|nr:hypothetical protein [Granulicella rosea]SNS21843.1 hypothetical protein SAMN05421770_10132 [Granulicella rosea]
MAGSIVIYTHGLPLWFLVLSLFLPRVSLALAWFWGDLVRFHLSRLIAPIVAPLLWLLLPRVLVLLMIYRDMGVGFWFVVHLVVAIMVWSGGGHQANKRRRDWD